MHDTDLVYVSCDAKWHFSDCGDTWTLHHFGSHNHAAPFASSPSQLGLHQIEEIIRNNPNMTPVQLVAGRCGRRTTTPTSKLDPKGFHRDFVSKIRGDVNEREFQKESGSKSGLGPHHLDATFHYRLRFTVVAKHAGVPGSYPQARYICRCEVFKAYWRRAQGTRGLQLTLYRGDSGSVPGSYPQAPRCEVFKAYWRKAQGTRGLQLTLLWWRLD